MQVVQVQNFQQLEMIEKIFVNIMDLNTNFNHTTMKVSLAYMKIKLHTHNILSGNKNKKLILSANDS